MHTVQIHDTYDMIANNRRDPMDLNCNLKLVLNISCNAVTYDMMAKYRHDPMDLNCNLKLLLNRSCSGVTYDMMAN